MKHKTSFIMVIFSVVVLLVLLMLPTQKHYAGFRMLPGMAATSSDGRQLCICGNYTATCWCCWIGPVTEY